MPAMLLFLLVKQQHILCPQDNFPSVVPWHGDGNGEGNRVGAVRSNSEPVLMRSLEGKGTAM